MSKKPKPPVPVYSALADATRCRILEILQTGPIPVHTLAAAFSISRPAISRHLRVLKTAGLVAEVKKGRENLYAFKPAKLERARLWLEALEGPNKPKTPVAQADAATPAAVKRVKSKKPVAIIVETVASTKPIPARKTTPAPTVPSEPISQMGFDF